MPLWASEFSSIVLVNRQSALARSSLAVAASVLSLLSLALPCRRAFVPGWWATQRRGVEAMEELTDMELIGGCAEQSAESRWELPRTAAATRKRGRSGYGMTIFAVAKVNPVSRVRFQLTDNVPLSAPGSRRLRSQGTPSQERETSRCTAPGMNRARRPTLSLSGGGAEGKAMPASRIFVLFVSTTSHGSRPIILPLRGDARLRPTPTQAEKQNSRLNCYLLQDRSSASHYRPIAAAPQLY
ncbi:hypothetical protein CMUS01_07701 [Colletotrichum musicola]|uniref:Uncharacterized protein n=1 Tax=Colletotrichum musicola TaxID=2175873 RepID=A0A8H6KGA7_9PEZI|nr:hypothetical protein CMUS01_07701 [Colletotrichum musicola]